MSIVVLLNHVLNYIADSSHAPSGLTGGARRRSRSGIMLVLNGAAVSWISKCQTSITFRHARQNTSPISLSQSYQETIWVREILAFLRAPQTVATAVFEGNSAALQISEQRAEHQAIKMQNAVDTRYHYSSKNMSERNQNRWKELIQVCTAGRHSDQSTHCVFWTWGRGADMN
jgi:hypothetical protein